MDYEFQEQVSSFIGPEKSHVLFCVCQPKIYSQSCLIYLLEKLDGDYENQHQEHYYSGIQYFDKNNFFNLHEEAFSIFSPTTIVFVLKIFTNYKHLYLAPFYAFATFLFFKEKYI